MLIPKVGKYYKIIGTPIRTTWYAYLERIDGENSYFVRGGTLNANNKYRKLDPGGTWTIGDFNVPEFEAEEISKDEYEVVSLLYEV